MADTMQAVVFYGKGDIRIEEVDVPKPGAKEVQVSCSSIDKRCERSRR